LLLDSVTAEAILNRVEFGYGAKKSEGRENRIKKRGVSICPCIAIRLIQLKEHLQDEDFKANSSTKGIR